MQFFFSHASPIPGYMGDDAYHAQLQFLGVRAEGIHLLMGEGKVRP